MNANDPVVATDTFNRNWREIHDTKADIPEGSRFQNAIRPPISPSPVCVGMRAGEKRTTPTFGAHDSLAMPPIPCTVQRSYILEAGSPFGHKAWALPFPSRSMSLAASWTHLVAIFKEQFSRLGLQLLHVPCIPVPRSWIEPELINAKLIKAPSHLLARLLRGWVVECASSLFAHDLYYAAS